MTPKKIAGKPQRLGKNSVANVVKLVSELSEKVALPDGVILRNNAEIAIWDQLTSMRAHGAWRDADLLVIGQLVRLESDYRECNKFIDKGGMFFSIDGKPKENPAIETRIKLQNQQQALRRSLSLNQLPQDPRTMNSQGQEKARLKSGLGKFDDLIAR